MPRLCHTIEQILAKLREAEAALRKDQLVVQVCRTLGITGPLLMKVIANTLKQLSGKITRWWRPITERPNP